jgi:putative aldouronate transport system permease protein
MVNKNQALNKPKFNEIKKKIKRHWQMYFYIALPITYLVIFRYVPMYGLQIAFKDYMLRDGFLRSPFVGLKWFKQFITSFYFPRLMKNTIGISLYSMVAGFAPPIILAVCLNECRIYFLKKGVQLITYAPYFLSTVVIVAILQQILSSIGLVSMLLKNFGFEPVNLLSQPTLFKSIYVWSGIWQSTGYSAIIYLASLAGINPELQEVAQIDGANIWQRIWHVDLPGILPTAIILLILSTAGILNVGFEKVYLMQGPLTMETSDVISTYTYRMGLVDMNYGFATAVGLFQSSISFVFMLVVNQIAKNLSEISLW